MFRSVIGKCALALPVSVAPWVVRAQETPASPTPVQVELAPEAARGSASEIVWSGDGGYGAIADDPAWYLFPQADRFSVRGWLNGGYMGNTSNPASKFNGPYNAIDRANEALFNQAYLIAERVLPTDGSVGVGGRVDLLYGFDYILAQSRGVEVNTSGSGRWNSSQYYGLALPQAYGQVGGEQLSLKLGHFYTIVGYEGVPALGNFFYSKAYSYQFAGPFTQWGGLGNWKPTEQIEVNAGLVNGWNSLEATQNHVNFLGSAKYTGASENWWTSFAIITGDEFNNPAGLPGINPQYGNRTRYSWIIDTKLGDRIEYVFHDWLGTQESGQPDGTTAWWYGVDQYLFYTLTDQWKLGTRFEWFRDQDGTRVGLNRPANPNKPPLPGNFFSLSAGVNYTPIANVIVRPEIRWDFYNGVAHPYSDGTKDNQLLLGFDAIFTY